MILIAEVLILFPAPVAVTSRLFGGGTQKLHKLLRVRDGQLAQHEGVEQTVDGGVGADRESQREHGHSREAEATPHQPQSIADVVQEHPH